MNEHIRATLEQALRFAEADIADLGQDLEAARLRVVNREAALAERTAQYASFREALDSGRVTA